MVDSPAVAAIAKWIIDMLAPLIQGMARDSFLETADCDLRYLVYRDRISVSWTSCENGVFWFEGARLSSLSGPLEQAAVARAVASAVQLELMMRFPTDPSGTTPTVDIRHSYLTLDASCGYVSYEKDGYADTHIMYTAPNGYYQAVRSWT